MALLFDAATENLAIADDAKWNFTPITQTRTFTFWWKTTSLPNANTEYQVFFYLSQSGGNKCQGVIYNNSGTNLLIGQILDSTSTMLGGFYCALPAVTSDVWYHMAFVFSTNNNCKIYWEASAQSVTHSSWDDTTAINPETIRLSSGVGLSDNFTMAHFAGFTDELSSTEIGNIRTAPYSMDSNANIICSIHMDEGTGTTAHDVQTVATQTDGTLTNTPTWAATPYLLRNLTGAIAGASTTPDITASLETIRNLLASILGASTTPNIGETISRSILANITGGSSTPDITATLQTIRNLLATVLGASTTPQISATMARSLAAAIAGGSLTPDILASLFLGAKYEPPNGRVIHGLGQYVDSFYTPAENLAIVTNYESAVGNDPTLYSIYTSIDPDAGWMDIQDLPSAYDNYVKVIGLMLWDSAYGASLIVTPSKILNGDWDARIIEIARQIKNIRGPVFVRPGFEFGSGNSGAHSLGMTAAQFIDIWQYIHDIFVAQGANNVAWVWNTVNPDDFTYSDWYPGDSYVDWWGINYFTASQISNADAFVEDAASHSKPVMICETNPIQGAGTTDVATWNNFFVPYFAKIAEYQHIKAFIYVSCPWTAAGFWEDNPDSRIDSTNTDSTILSNYISELGGAEYINLEDKGLIIPADKVYLATPINGQGSVTRTPDAAEYDVNAEVALEADPAANWGFFQWGDDLSGNTNPDSITLTADATVSAFFARELAAAIAAASTTPNISVTQARAILAAISGASSTSDITAALAGIRNLLAAISAASSTPEVSVTMSRALLAVIAGNSSTTEISATVVRAMLAAIVGGSITPDIARTLLRGLNANLAATSSTPEISVVLNRALIAAIAGQSLTPEITATIQGIISLIARIAGASSTPDISALTARQISSSISVSSATPDILAAIARNLLSSIAGASTTPDITATLENMISFSAAISGVSVTPEISVNIARTLSALMAGQSITPEIQATIARMLLADIQGTSLTPNDLILILAGLGAIIDPTSISLTPERTSVSLTPERTSSSI